MWCRQDAAVRSDVVLNTRLFPVLFCSRPYRPDRETPSKSSLIPENQLALFLRSFSLRCIVSLAYTLTRFLSLHFLHNFIRLAQKPYVKTESTRLTYHPVLFNSLHSTHAILHSLKKRKKHATALTTYFLI